MRRILAILILATLLAGCAGTPFKWQSVRSIQVGDTQSQVHEAMGKPYLVKVAEDIETWVWSYSNTLSGVTRSVSLSFQDGVVVKVPTIPDSFK